MGSATMRFSPTYEYRHDVLRESRLQRKFLLKSFSWLDTEEFTSTRHFDLQKFFKWHRNLVIDEDQRVERVRSTLDTLSEAFESAEILRNRAITVSVILLAIELNLAGERANQFAEFVEEFLCRLRWQVKRGLEVDFHYRYLIDFNKHVTQASVEKYAVRARAEFLREGFAHWEAEGTVLGDDEYREAEGLDPMGRVQEVITPGRSIVAHTAYQLGRGPC